MKSYRIDQPRPKPKNRTMQDTATPGTVHVHNGCTADLAIPCFYMEIHPPVPARPHDRMVHDMLGWPWPDKPDRCCQEWDLDRRCCRRSPHMECCPPRCEHFLDMRRLFPIRLAEEGYQTVSAYVLDSDKNSADGISATATIDAKDDWIIRVRFDVRVPGLLTPADDPAVYYYSVYLNMNSKRTRDLAAMGRLVVLPSPIGAEPSV